MAKKYKIKRYNRIYRKNRSSRITPATLLLTVVGIGVLAFLGYSLYQPVYNLLTGGYSSTIPSGSSPAPISQSVPEQSEPVVIPEQPQQVKGIYMPPQVMLDAAARTEWLDRIAGPTNVKEGVSLLDAASGVEVNTVVLDVKTSDGRILYQSALEQVAMAGSMTADPIDLKAVIGEINARGLKVAVRMQAFRDPLAGAVLPDLAIKYVDNNWLWLDNSKELGGKTWLNPYSTEARAYLGDIAAEVTNMGAEIVIMDSVQFPEGVGLDLARFGYDSGSVTKTDALKRFVTEVSDKVQAAGGKLYTYMTSTSLFGVNTDRYAGAPAAFLGENVALSLMPAQFGDIFESSAYTVNAPVQNPYGTVKAALEQDQLLLGGERKLLAFVQGYTASGLVNGKTYSWQEVADQIRAAKEGGVESYVIYSPDGIYPYGV